MALSFLDLFEQVFLTLLALPRCRPTAPTARQDLIDREHVKSVKPLVNGIRDAAVCVVRHDIRHVLEDFKVLDWNLRVVLAIPTDDGACFLAYAAFKLFRSLKMSRLNFARYRRGTVADERKRTS